MRKIKIYLDTSVINYLDATHMPQQMQDTVDLWDIFSSDERFEVTISGVVEREIKASPEEKRKVLFDEIAKIRLTFLPTTMEVVNLSERYLEFGILSPKSRDDLFHIAHATVHGCQMIASWNFKHFVNFKTMDCVNAVNLIEGYAPIKIASPSMILGEIGNER